MVFRSLDGGCSLLLSQTLPWPCHNKSPPPSCFLPQILHIDTANYQRDKFAASSALSRCSWRFFPLMIPTSSTQLENISFPILPTSSTTSTTSIPGTHARSRHSSQTAIRIVAGLAWEGWCCVMPKLTAPHATAAQLVRLLENVVT
jgi:hypothetical protein